MARQRTTLGKVGRTTFVLRVVLRFVLRVVLHVVLFRASFFLAL